MSLETLGTQRCFGGWLQRLRHRSTTVDCDMTFAVYLVHELPALVEAHFSASDRRGISGHSMGGHGALVCTLRNPGRYRSVSAFAR